ncbi:hypothetical protein Q9L58_001177 [Maublancomyces gigas]|uniref:RNase III domain-containing protein n=1 Tax=Discina gigas TaxID=1032678 RepID=A0ABR3GV87_9PEZI
MKCRNWELTTSFENFEDAMCDLLSSASVVTNLHGVLGDEKANFVIALQNMIAIGDLAWVKEIDSDGEEVAYDTATADGVQPPMFREDKTPRQLPVTTYAAQSPPQPWPPPLPPIPNPSLLLQVFTPSETEVEDDPQAHYQRLEWVGDAYLEAVVSKILFDRFPDEREGYLSKIREKLVANKPISYLAKLYGFENRIMGIRDLPEISENGRNKADEHWKILADCFEAYVGAVAISDPENSLDTLMNWLVSLYGPEIEMRRDNRQSPVPRSKVLFSAAPAIRRPEFRRTRSPSVLQPLGVGQYPNRRPENTRARSRSLPGPTASKRSRRRELRESGLPTTIDENESDWEEIENLEEVTQSSTQIPLNDNAKIHLQRILGGDDVVLNYVQTGKSGAPGGEPGKTDCQQGHQFHVMILFTGCGLINKALGSGYGVSE